MPILFRYLIDLSEQIQNHMGLDRVSMPIFGLHTLASWQIVKNFSSEKHSFSALKPVKKADSR